MRQSEEMGLGSVVTINGNPAWVAEADSLAPGNPRFSFVDMSIGSVQVLLSADMPLADLMEVAKTIGA